MIVPRYWAEGRLRHRDRKRQVTVRRFGWSDTSQEEAQANADRRTREALDQRLAGAKLPTWEPRVPYNGADGVPIREEIVSRHGETIITRNSYGALCLNTPDVLFADVDFRPMPSVEEAAGIGGLWLLSLAGTGWAIWGRYGPFVLPVGFFACLFTIALVKVVLSPASASLRGGNEQIVRRRLRSFVAANPGWHLRLYRTPAGMRALALHRKFHPGDVEVRRCFRVLGVDKVFATMCRRQQCFRARVSPKPWRIGLTDHLRPRPGTWPVAPERLPARAAWVERYEAAARGHAACQFVGSFGSEVEHPDAKAVCTLHDELCGANSGRPIA